MADHDGGVVRRAPGVYLMGVQFLRRRKSALIDGAADGARDLSEHMASYLGRSSSIRASLPAAAAAKRRTSASRSLRPRSITDAVA